MFSKNIFHFINIDFYGMLKKAQCNPQINKINSSKIFIIKSDGI